MAYPPQGFLFQPSVSLALHSCPSFSSSIILGPRTEELGRSSSGSAFAPSFVNPGYDPSSGITGSLDYHPFGALGPYPYGDPTYRKNATRDATATLKAWLNEHRKNPYPTKGEKIMLAIITKMTLTQVSTWFANARRRLKKENKMTWTPRNRSEDEEEEDNIDLERNDEDEEPMKANNEMKTKSEPASVGGNSCGIIYREDAGSRNDSDRDLTDPDFKDARDRGMMPHILGPNSAGGPPQNAPLVMLRGSERVASPTSKDRTGDNSTNAVPAPKPKLWSLAEIATSSDKSKGSNDSPLGVGQHVPTHLTPTPTPRTPFPHSTTLTRHLYYTSPFIPGYSNYSTLGPLHGGPCSNLASATHLNGLHQTMLQRAEAMMARDCKLRSQSQLEICKDLTQHELKKGTTNI
ncbi:hypothetical protein LDENG_00067780 [Lucifuga dentata]|nr:hypothetical protein LDENG_00067780 [Lucifuga dentata]